MSEDRRFTTELPQSVVPTSKVVSRSRAAWRGLVMDLACYATPPYVSCKEVCSEYAKSSHFGVEVAYTCDATLCTASSDPLLVHQACSGLANSSVSETLKLEVAVGKSCAASQICGCVPTKQTSKQIFRFNVEQHIRGIPTQCDLNGTLCGEP